MTTDAMAIETRTQRMQLLNELLEQGFPWMRFPQALEQEYLMAAGPRRLRHFLISGLIALLVFNIFLLADYLMVRDVFKESLIVRTGVFTPIGLLTILLGWRWRRKSWVLAPLMLDGGVMLSGILAAATLSYVLAITNSSLSQFYHVGFTVILLYGNVVQRLRSWYAIAFSVIIFSMHLCGVIFQLQELNPRIVVPVITMMAGSGLFTLAANYALERDERRRYLLTARERELVASLSEINVKLQELSRVDALTALFNRRHFLEYIQHVWQRAKHNANWVSIILIDVDCFKGYNDLYGHPAGDACLAQLAETIQGCMRRPEEMLARYGGEEFIAVLPEASFEVTIQAAERIRLAVQNLAIRYDEHGPFPIVTVSVGVAFGNASVPGRAVEFLISQADRSLSEAKREGRNRVSTYRD